MAQFFSTRNDKEKVSATKAIINGIATDGGLYVPEKFENIYKECIKLNNYVEVCNKVLSSFFPEIDISEQVHMAYNKFSKDPPVVINKVGDFNVMELYHGPTCAFKDFALSLLPSLIRESKNIENDSNDTVILTATSGDTGKAALESFSNKATGEKDIQIVVLYPQNGVSDIQKIQMTTQEGSNVRVIGIKGNFDDAQNAVKDFFSDKKLRESLIKNNMNLSSANSINIGRLIPQIAYYFFSYIQLISRGQITEGEKVSFSVPTGNFGDILAGYYAKKMGLPIYRLICASNENDVLTKFFETGIYNKKRKLLYTASPSMDILISSNLERLLYHVSGSTHMVLKWMNQLEKEGSYCIFGDDDKFNKNIKKELEVFVGFSSNHVLSQDTINKTYKKYKYLMDTHSAVAYSAAAQSNLPGKTIVISTASPFKFASSVCESLGLDSSGMSEFEILDLLSSKTCSKIPKQISELRNKKIIHNLTVPTSEIKETVTSLLYKQDKKIIIRVPATSANIGPGFDSLGMALNLYTDISFEQSGVAKDNNSDNIDLDFIGFETKYVNRENLVYTSFVKTLNHIHSVLPQKLCIGIKSEVPVCRGLGSSAACIVAAVKAAYELSGVKYSNIEILEMCNLIEGHPDNVTPALMGGFTAAIQKNGKVFMSNIPVSKDLRLFAFVPDFTLSTEYSRSVLPQSVDFKDAVYNVSHAALMIAAFVNNEFDILKIAVSDKLHQKYRSKIIDEYEDVMKICEDMSSTANFLSGSGPTVMVIDQNLDNTLDIYQQKLSTLTRSWKAYELKIDFEGTRLK